MRLFLTHRSPYARKVQLTLAHKGLSYQEIVVDLANRSPEFVAVSPLGKVPVLVDGDITVYDSTVIVEYLEDRYPEPALRGGTWAERLGIRQLEELGDSLSDQAIAIFFGRQNGTPTAKAEATVGRILGALEERAKNPHDPMHGTNYGAFSVLSALGYLELRLGNGWRDQHPTLAEWATQQDNHPHAIATRPRLT